MRLVGGQLFVAQPTSSSRRRNRACDEGGCRPLAAVLADAITMARRVHADGRNWGTRGLLTAERRAQQLAEAALTGQAVTKGSQRCWGVRPRPNRPAQLEERTRTGTGRAAPNRAEQTTTTATPRCQGCRGSARRRRDRNKGPKKKTAVAGKGARDDRTQRRAGRTAIRNRESRCRNGANWGFQDVRTNSASRPAPYRMVPGPSTRKGCVC